MLNPAAPDGNPRNAKPERHTKARSYPVPQKMGCTHHLVRTIKSFIDDYTETAAPFVWVATADSIFQKIESLSIRICGTEH